LVGGAELVLLDDCVLEDPRRQVGLVAEPVDGGRPLERWAAGDDLGRAADELATGQAVRRVVEVRDGAVQHRVAQRLLVGE
jgi:hypothetical protein